MTGQPNLGAVFDANWLTLRETADAHARDAGEAARLAARWAAGRAAAPLAIVDLGTGTGANVRYLAPWLGPRQSWRALDNDSALLESARALTARWVDEDQPSEPVPIEPVSNAPEIEFSGSRADAPVPAFDGHVSFVRESLAGDLSVVLPDRVSLVTASALLDLVSDEWVRALVARMGQLGAAGLFAQSYDGRMSWLPAHADDAWMHACFDADQRTDKGFGRALGPAAGRRAAALFESAGFDVQAIRADWRLSSSQAALQEAMIEGWASAVSAGNTQHAARVSRWREDRLAHLCTGVAELRVGHVDLFARPDAR